MMSRKIDKLNGLAVITGASSGIGLELTKLAAADGCALILSADTDLTEAERAAKDAGAASVETVQCDLATERGVAALLDAIGKREVDALFANAGHGGDVAFLDQDWQEVEHIIATNVSGTVRLIQDAGRAMRARNRGRILITGSIAGHMPGPFQLVYNSTKAFMNDFSVGLRNELKDTDVVVTCLQPGVTDTNFFQRAHMLDSQAGKSDSKDDPAKVAKDGYQALLADDDLVVSGFMNKMQAMFADVLPDSVVAQMHRKLAEPESRKENEPA